MAGSLRAHSGRLLQTGCMPYLPRSKACRRTAQANIITISKGLPSETRERLFRGHFLLDRLDESGGSASSTGHEHDGPHRSLPQGGGFISGDLTKKMVESSKTDEGVRSYRVKWLPAHLFAAPGEVPAAFLLRNPQFPPGNLDLAMLLTDFRGSLGGERRSQSNEHLGHNQHFLIQE